jgi:hypothetical protein
MAVIDAHGAHEIARVTCDRVTTSKGVEIEVSRLFVMTSDGRILTRDLDTPLTSQGYHLAARWIRSSALGGPVLLAWVRDQGYRVKT